jgi:hypothetical protein
MPLKCLCIPIYISITTTLKLKDIKKLVRLSIIYYYKMIVEVNQQSDTYYFQLYISGFVFVYIGIYAHMPMYLEPRSDSRALLYCC